MHLRAALRLLLANVAIFGLLFLVAEGAASVVRRARSLTRPAAAGAMEPYVQHDRELGWTLRPGARVGGDGVPEMVHVESHGFRSAHDIGPASPSRARLACSGDSFTFGDGVADGATWCAQLEAIDRSRESVNLGVPGYGIDQAYLRYLRDARGLGERVHVFAFIDDDFRRMGVRHDKPYLTADGGRLIVHNVPVPPFQAASRFAAAVEELSLVQLAGSLGARLRAARGTPADGPAAGVLRAVVDALAATGRERGSAQIVVRLPSMEPVSRYAIEFLAAATGSLTVVDLRERFEALPDTTRWAMTLDGLEPGSHLNEAGHAWVARALNPVIADAARQAGATQELHGRVPDHDGRNGRDQAARR